LVGPPLVQEDGSVRVLLLALAAAKSVELVLLSVHPPNLRITANVLPPAKRPCYLPKQLALP
jgi:hypothetical protein